MAIIKTFGGLDNQNDPLEYGLNRLAVAKNVDITRENKIVTRKGRTKLSDAQVELACATKKTLIYQSIGNLYQISDKTGAKLVARNLTSASWLTATEINNKIFWSNGVQIGVIENNKSRDIGIKTPDTPLYAEMTGTMPEGNYLFAITYTRNDGMESGASLSGQAIINSGGIKILKPSKIPDNTKAINIYLSTVNGEVLYLAASYDITQSVPTLKYVGDTLNFGVALENQFCDQPKPFQASCYYKGRNYYAVGDVLWASLPFNLELVDYTKDYLPFDGEIVMLAEVSNGIYVATTEKTYYLSGNDPQDFTVIEALNYGAIRSAPVKADKLKDGSNAMLWASPKGAIAGLDGGQVLNMTDGVFTFGQSATATGVFREINGQRHFVVSLNTPKLNENVNVITNLREITAKLTLPMLLVA